MSETSKRIWNDSVHDLSAGAFSQAGTLVEALGIEFIELGKDYLKARMPVQAATQQRFGRLHGGASLALAETMGGTAADLTLDNERFIAVGMEINANHVRPAKDGFVYAVARPEALGRRSQVWSIRITDDAGKLVCISRMTLAVIPVETA